MYMAWENVLNKKLRSFLTILGVIVGIGSISFLVSFAVGLQRIVIKNIVDDRAVRSIEITSTNSKIVKLNNDVVNKIRNYPHIEKLGVSYAFPASLMVKSGGIDAVIYGVDQQYQTMTRLSLISGRLLTKEDNRSVVISSAALTSLGVKDEKKILNEKIEITVPLLSQKANTNELKDRFTVVGIIDAGKNSEAYVPAGVFQAAGISNYKQVKIYTDSTKNLAQLRKQIESNGLQTTSPADTLEQINQLFKVFAFVLAGFGGIGIFVAILGMFNTLTISLLERTKEIGLMLSLGARRRDMRRLFMLEAVILSFVGSVAGVLLSLIGGLAANQFINMRMNSANEDFLTVFYMPVWLGFGLTACMVAVGLLVSVLPARRAERINPIDALRRE